MKLRHLTAATLFAIAAAAPAHADVVVTDFTFDSTPLGSPVPTTFPLVDPQPQQNVYAVGGFPDSGPVTGTVTVQNAGTLFHAAEMTTTQGGTGALWLDTQFISSGARQILSFDIDVLGTPATGLPQGDKQNLNGQPFAMNVFGDVGRAMRFIVAPTSPTGGVFGLRDLTSDGFVVPFGIYTDGQTHHFEFDMDFVSHTLNAYFDGTQVESNYGFIDPVSDLTELFLFDNGVEGQTTSVAFDNLILNVVPEPVTVSLFGAGLVGVAMLRRRRRVKR